MANYATMKKDELIALAQEKGVEADATMTKTQIIAAIESAENVTAEPESAVENVKEPAEDSAMELLKAQNELLRQQMEELQKQLLALQRPQVIQVAADTERVYFLWQAEVADYNLVTFGPGGMYGSITGKTGTFSVPKNELSRILDNRTRGFIARRWLIVVDGLTDEEREAMGVAYAEGEIMDRKVFSRMVNLSKDEICEVYEKLCESHKEMVGRRYYEEWQSKNPAVTREKVIALRNITRDQGLEIKAFQTILQEMNASEEEE
jgi:hypothetical protein